MTNKKFEPQRMCLVCRTKHAKHLLTRYVMPKDAQTLVVAGINMVLDKENIREQRGFYLCSESKCHEKFQKLKLKNKKGKKA